MSILANKNTRLIVQGITGNAGSFFAREAIEYGTHVVAGVRPGKGGQKHLGVPIFNSIREAVDTTNANASMLFVPPTVAAGAMLEAVEAGMDLIVCITEGIPILDSLRVKQAVKQSNTVLVGPNSAGVITPGECKIGIMPASVFSKGSVGVVARSGTLFYEAVNQLTSLGIGQSTCVGMGADPVRGMSFVDYLKLFEEDPGTDAILLIGEIGGIAEEEAAAYLIENPTHKPIIAYVAGHAAPRGRRMGHASAMITRNLSGSLGDAQSKVEALGGAGVRLPESAAQIGAVVANVLK